MGPGAPGSARLPEAGPPLARPSSAAWASGRQRRGHQEQDGVVHLDAVGEELARDDEGVLRHPRVEQRAVVVVGPAVGRVRRVGRGRLQGDGGLGRRALELRRACPRRTRDAARNASAIRRSPSPPLTPRTVAGRFRPVLARSGCAPAGVWLTGPLLEGRPASGAYEETLRVTTKRTGWCPNRGRHGEVPGPGGQDGDVEVVGRAHGVLAQQLGTALAIRRRHPGRRRRDRGEDQVELVGSGRSRGQIDLGLTARGQRHRDDARERGQQALPLGR